MKVCLVGAPAVTDFADREFAESDAVRLVAHQSPLGVLTLAGIIRQAGVEVSVVDPDALFFEYLRSQQTSEARGFAGFAAAHLAAQDFDVVGFGTLCSSYPVTLRIAEVVKHHRPDTALVLGGPQASVVDRESIEAFPFVDFIVRGEADRSFPEFLSVLGAGRPRVEEVAGLTFRADGKVVQTASAPPIRDLDSLPLPAFDLYPQAGTGAHLPLELGRGCPYGCTFCATNDFFRRKFRLKSAATMLAQMRELRDTFEIKSFSLVHDMFTVDRKRVIEFCETLLTADEGFLWSCSARTDRVDDELMELMHAAGCRGIFFGIETGSQRLQKVIAKNLRIPAAAATIRSADRIGIETEVSLITGFAEETREDLADTVAFYVDSMRLEHTDGNIGLLSPLAGTPIEQEHRAELVFDELHSDVSFQGWHQDEADRELILAHPEVFSNFFAVPMRHLSRRYVHELREFAVHGIEWFRRLIVALHQDSERLIDVFDDWRDWVASNGDQAPAGQEHVPYYIRSQFRSEFLGYLEERYIPETSRARDVLQALVNYERTFNDPDHTFTAPDFRATPRPEFQPDAVPRLTPGVRLLSVPLRFDQLDKALLEGSDLAALDRSEAVLAAAPTHSGSPKVRQMSKSLAGLLSQCNGRGTVASIADRMASFDGEVAGVPLIRACQFGLFTLWKQGFVGESSRAGAA